MGAPPVVDPYVRSGQLVRWKDGDTCVVLVDYGFRQGGEWPIRLVTGAGPYVGPYVDAPEIRKKQPGAVEALAHVRALLPAGARLVLRTFSEDPETLGRYLGAVWTLDGIDLGLSLLEHRLTKDTFGKAP